MIAGAAVADSLEVGWAALREFFREGSDALARALAALQQVEAQIRASKDPMRQTLWLLGMATALRYTRKPEPMATALERARELVNLTARTQGEAASVPFRTHVEAIGRDLADVIPSQAQAYLDEALAYAERTVRLARAAARDEWLAPALASRGDLLVRRSVGHRGEVRRGRRLLEEARRRWPLHDAEGLAQTGVRYAEALLISGDPSGAERIAREALAVFEVRGDRYHAAGAHLVLARALLALDRDEALDEHAAAVALYHRLGCRWELTRAERALG
jgi:tetratricopeptide (TPR) repeat protein